MIMYVMYVNNNSTNQIQCHGDVHCSGIPILSLSDIERLHILDIQTYRCDAFFLRHVQLPYAWLGLCFVWTAVDRCYTEISLSLQARLRKSTCRYSWMKSATCSSKNLYFNHYNIWVFIDL